MENNQENQDAHGGKRNGSGRPKGSRNKLNILDFVSGEDIEKIVNKAVALAKTDNGSKERIFIIEQIYGKARQSVDMDVSLPDTLIGLIKNGITDEN